MRWIRLTIIVILISALLAPSDADARRKQKKRPKKARAAKSMALASHTTAFLWNISANKHLYAKNIDKRVYPASTTKVMTALLALQRLAPDKYVRVSRRATLVQPTRLSLRPGEQYKPRDLLYAILLKSANDAAVVLAEAVSGSESQFVAQMNKKAASLGATQTRFANSHGLPSKLPQYTTARDMAVIFREALKDPLFRKIISFKSHIIYSKEGRRHFLKSHNKGLFLNWKANIYGKTGYTQQAQSCFVGYTVKGGQTYIVSIFHSRRRWENIKFIMEQHGRLDL